ncbi:MAG: HAD-IA family hydrolase [Phycisphaeraceae bacterium]|nr:HAD-IA family hydrolase [Phycisphaeraceae bacterium]
MNAVYDDIDRFAAVVFDMDGVLCDSEPFIREAGCLMFQRAHGVKVSPEDFKPFTGMGEDRFLGGVAERHGVKLTMPDDKRTTYAIYLELIKGRLAPLPGAVAFIQRCRQAGLKLAVATSADRVKMDGNLSQIGVPPEVFDVCVTGSDVQRKKPDPQVFQLAASKLGLSPSQCLVVEDAPEGIVAGVAAGSKCLGLTTSFTAETLRGRGATWIAPDLAHVPDDLMQRLAPGR